MYHDTKIKIVFCLPQITNIFLAQLVDYLQTNGMGKYESTFLKEGVTGEVLLDCDEELLQSGLGIVSKLHRIKLMKIISGRESVF